MDEELSRLKREAESLNRELKETDKRRSDQLEKGKKGGRENKGRINKGSST